MHEATFTDAAREGLAEEMARDPMIFVVGEGIGPRGGNFNTTTGLYDLYGPWRLRDTPISERGFTAMCTGAAAAGARPVVDYMFLDFALDAMGDIINQTSKLQWLSLGRLKMPIVLRAAVGVNNTSAHHSADLYSFFMHLPGLRVVVPSTPADAKGLLKTAIRSDDPVVYLEHKKLMPMRGEVPDGEHLVPLGKGRVAREGKDLTIFGVGITVVRALEAADALAKEGISAEVLDPRSLAPFDWELVLDSVAKTHRLLVVDEDYATCGLSAEVMAGVMEQAFDELDAPVRRVCGMAVPAPYSPPLEAVVVPDAAAVVKAAKALLAE